MIVLFDAYDELEGKGEAACPMCISREYLAYKQVVAQQPLHCVRRPRDSTQRLIVPRALQA